MSQPPSHVTLICRRVADLRRPPVTSVKQRCCGCHRLVWVALSSPPRHRVVCMQCAAISDKQVERDDVHITTEQMAEIEDHLYGDSPAALCRYCGQRVHVRCTDAIYQACLCYLTRSP